MVIISNDWRNFRIDVLFLIVDATTTYNAILRWTTINANGILPSILDQNMKFPTPHMEENVWGD